MKTKSIAAVSSLLLIATPAKAVCVFGVGNSCPIDDRVAAAMLRPLVNGKLVGRFTVRHTILFDELRLGQSELKFGDNGRRLARSRAVQAYMNGGKDCHKVEAVWAAELLFKHSKRDFCELAQTMNAHGVSEVATFVGSIQPTKAGLRQAISLRFALTESGRANVERYLLARDTESFTVATGYLNFLRVLGKHGAAPVTAVKFQFEVVPNVWAHIENGLRQKTLRPEREIGNATFRNGSNDWQLVEGPSFGPVAARISSTVPSSN
jgi:hypothetical protein